MLWGRFHWAEAPPDPCLPDNHDRLQVRQEPVARNVISPKQDPVSSSSRTVSPFIAAALPESRKY
eukprot:751960-Hanusia_phi.AAC.5